MEEIADTIERRQVSGGVELKRGGLLMEEIADYIERRQVSGGVE